MGDCFRGLTAPELIWLDSGHQMHIVEQHPNGTIKHTDPLELNEDEIFYLCDHPRNFSIPEPFRQQVIFDNPAKKFVLEEPITLHTRAAFESDGSLLNLTLMETTLGQVKSAWRGHLVVYPTAIKDVTLCDFRSFLDFCKFDESDSGGLATLLRTNACGTGHLEETNLALFHSVVALNSTKLIEGVGIASEGDLKYLHSNQFLGIQVPDAHPIIDDHKTHPNWNYTVSGGALPVSTMIGLPLLVSCLIYHE